MNIGFVINDLHTEKAVYTTVRLAMAAANREHTVWFINVDDLAYGPGGHMSVQAVSARPAKSRYRATSAYLKAVRAENARHETISIETLDVLMLRNDPASDVEKRPWAVNAGVQFGRMAAARGVIVLNDPDGLTRAPNKLYLEHFPEAVRPRTLITRDRAALRAFIAEQGGSVVLKPLHGSGGRGVFLVEQNQRGNINQIYDAISRDGWVIAQAFIPEAMEGDTRIFIMNGVPLCVKGKYAAFKRVRAADDFRNNVAQGGELAPAEITPAVLNTLDLIRPQLVRDGMFLVGVDIAGDKLLEINVFSPGGLGSAQKMMDVSFTATVIRALERKVTFRTEHYPGTLTNSELATL